MEETQRTLDEFWNKHASHLKLCLQLRQFELDFRELQVNDARLANHTGKKKKHLTRNNNNNFFRTLKIVLNEDIQTVSDFETDGDSVAVIDALLQQTFDCRTRCQVSGRLIASESNDNVFYYRCFFFHLFRYSWTWIEPMHSTATRPI